MSAKPTLKVGASLLTPEGRAAARDVARERWAVYMRQSGDPVLTRLGAALVCYAAARAVTSSKKRRMAARRRDLERQTERNASRSLRIAEALADLRAENAGRLS